MRLWIPGPTHVRPELLAECARPMIGHRSKAMQELIARLDPHLRLAFGLAQGSDAVVGAHLAAARRGHTEASYESERPVLFKLVRTSSATCSGVMPYRRMTSSPGAEAPKPSMPSTRPGHRPPASP